MDVKSITIEQSCCKLDCSSASHPSLIFNSVGQDKMKIVGFSKRFILLDARLFIFLALLAVVLVTPELHAQDGSYER